MNIPNMTEISSPPTAPIRRLPVIPNNTTVAVAAMTAKLPSDRFRTPPSPNTSVILRPSNAIRKPVERPPTTSAITCWTISEAIDDQELSTGTVTKVYIYTTDIAAGEGAETVLASEGYGDSITFVNGFRFIEDLVSS
jgi:hypothetical protein